MENLLPNLQLRLRMEEMEPQMVKVTEARTTVMPRPQILRSIRRFRLCRLPLGWGQRGGMSLVGPERLTLVQFVVAQESTSVRVAEAAQRQIGCQILGR
ncbi:MAG: hypothetical protein APF78_08645 [Sphingomonadales bacterium BRH_c3]|nr:MAG: hypothetical protein APF78_08645 [Sphingomonadales bacterium BRH_c3]